MTWDGDKWVGNSILAKSKSEEVSIHFFCYCKDWYSYLNISYERLLRDCLKKYYKGIQNGTKLQNLMKMREVNSNEDLLFHKLMQKINK